MSRRSLTAFAVLAGAALMGSAGNLAAADDRPHANTIEFINETPYTVLRIFPHMDDVTDWEDDLLGNDVLESGQRFKANLDLGPGHCVFEMTVNLANEQRLYYRRFDACKETALHMTMAALDPQSPPATGSGEAIQTP